MKCKLRWLLILVILTAFAVWLEPTRVVWGWLRREAFYDGRPTSYWASELERWGAVFIADDLATGQKTIAWASIRRSISLLTAPSSFSTVNPDGENAFSRQLEVSG